MLVVVAGGVFFARGSLGIGHDKAKAPSSAAASTAARNFVSSSRVLVEGDIGMPSTLNPLLASSQTERDLTKLIFSCLIRVDGAGTPQPDLADTWTVSEDGLTYTITLKPGITWQDGKPFTSQDVRYTIGLIQSPGFPGDQRLAQFWRPIVVDTPNDSTVVFHLKEPFAPFLNDLDLPILPKHILGGVVAEDLALNQFNSQPIGTGPFSLVSWDVKGRQIKLEAFAGYRGEKPRLSAITFRYYADPEKLLADLRDGSVQATGTVPSDELLRAGALSKQDTIYAPVAMSYTALFFNTRDAPFSDQRVRQAVRLAVNPSDLINGPLRSEAVAGTSPIPQASWAYAAQEATYDPQRAGSLLQDAGWTYAEHDGVLEKGGVRLSFQLLVNADDPQRMLMAQTIAQQLGAIHIQVDVTPATSENISQALSNRQFTAAIFGGHYGNGDPDCFDVWSSTGSANGLNITGLNDDTIDKVLREARAATDVGKRRELYQQFQQEFIRQVPAVILYYPRYLFVVSSDLHGVKPDPVIDPSDRFQQVSSWYFGANTSLVGTP